MEANYVIGLDFGTDSVRAVIVDTATGDEIAHSVQQYKRWKMGKYCDAHNNQFRQHPLDYIEALENSIKQALALAPADTAQKIKGIAVDTTGSTPVAVNEKCIPLALLDEYAENPNAMFILWKDHTAIAEAAEINKKAKEWQDIDYTKYVGGIYSSEWFWAKILHTMRNDPQVREGTFSWLEHCDWIPALLTGTNDPTSVKRSRCAAGHKALWHEQFNGLPPEDFWVHIDPLLKGLRERLFTETYTNDQAAGTLCQEWAERLGLSTDTVIGVGAFDAHMGAIGGEIEPYTLCKIIGTSTCDIMVAPNAEIGDTLIKGICGQVDGSVLPGMLGMEAGQSAFGDIYAWFKRIVLWPSENVSLKELNINDDLINSIKDHFNNTILTQLQQEAEKIPIGSSNITSLDWMNGRRTPDANQALQGVISGLNLGSNTPAIFRSLVEATAFGARKIVERFKDEGVDIKGVIALGGVAKKSPFIMQVLADVLNMEIKVARSEQACALGAAMCAAVAAGLHSTFHDAQKAMGSGFETIYKPNQENHNKYNQCYDQYLKLAHLIETYFSNGGIS